MFRCENILVSLFLFLFFRLCICFDTITTVRPLKFGDLLVSNSGNFALGFFSPKNSSNRYVGIWYSKVSEQTLVWVANRDNPITNLSDVIVLAINETGNLVLHETRRGFVFWSTNVSVGVNGSARLLDSGNLKLSQGDQDKDVVWQSSDYPTNTLLPGMKFGLDRITGLNRRFTSWKSSADPGTGEYSLRMEFVGSPQAFLYKGTTRVWRIGTWTGHGWSGVPEMMGIMNVTFIDNEEETVLIDGIMEAQIFPRMVMNETGLLERLIWQEADSRWIKFSVSPKYQCDGYNHCGSFGLCDSYKSGKFECDCFPGYEPRTPRDWYRRDWSGGCVRKVGAQVCGAGEGFEELARVKIPDTSVATLVDKNLGVEACKELCLRNCSCTGYARDDASGCITWYGDMVDTTLFSDGGQSMFIRVDAAELAKNSSKKSKNYHANRIVAIWIPMVAAGFIMCACIWCYIWKKRANQRKREIEFNLSNNLTTFEEVFMDNNIGENGDLRAFDLCTIVAATDNFSLSNKLGEGGFGSVYKGKLQNGQEIATKRLSHGSGQGMEEFKNEVTLIAKLQHRNLVRLLGYCFQKDEKMLIYEYLPNKGLDCFIFDSEKGSLLDWKKRFKIIQGIVRGLLYLHQDSRLTIIHRDMKASNVLLDQDLNPKISDFGMAKIFGGDQDEARTRRIVGTYGYMSPEYAMEGLFSVKSDVYSFGVLLLEIISGRKNNSYYLKNSINLISHVWDLWKQDKALRVVDSSLGDSYDARQVLSCIHVGLLCIQESASDRPTMTGVAFMLSNHETTFPPPNRPAFIFKKSNSQAIDLTPASTSGGLSVFDETITIMEAR